MNNTRSKTNRHHAFLLSLAIAGAALLLMAASSSAATVHVATSGIDTPTCGPVATPCLTISHSLVRAADGDTVLIGPGTFPTTYNPIGAKSLTIQGSGKGVTIVDGQNSTSAAGNGMFRFNRQNTSSTIRDLSVVNPAATSPTAKRYVIIVQPGTAAPANPLYETDLVLRDVEIEGGGGNDLPFSSAHNGGTLDIAGLTTTNVAGNSVYLEQVTGQVTIADGSFSALGNQYAIFDQTFGAAKHTITATHRLANNVVTSAGAASGNAIGFNATGSTSFARVEVVGNRLSALGFGPGIDLNGSIDDTLIDANNIRGYATGIRHNATGNVQVSRNQLVNNESAGNRTGIRSQSLSGTINASDNWWGCNAGPMISADPTAGSCDAIVEAIPGSVTVNSWIVLGIGATPAVLAADGAAAVTADLSRNNLGVPVGGVFADGTTVAFAGTGGNVADPTRPTTSALATTGFQSTAIANRTASAVFDHQTSTFAWPDVPVPPVIPAPPVSESELDLVPTCSRQSLLITNMQIGKRYARISGTTRRSLAGEHVRIYFKPTGRRVVARARVDASGRFHTRVKRPSRKTIHRGNTRYRAEIAGDHTPWLKLARRLRLSNVHTAGGKLHVDGRVVGADRGARLVVTKSSNCGSFNRIGSIPIGSNRIFDGSIPTKKQPIVVLVRMRATIRSSDGKRAGSTYSIPQPMLISG